MRLKGTGFFSDLMHTYIYLLATKIITVLWRTFFHNAFLVDSELSYVIEKLFTISVFLVSFGLQRFKFGLWERLHLVTKTIFSKFLFSFSSWILSVNFVLPYRIYIWMTELYVIWASYIGLGDGKSLAFPQVAYALPRSKGCWKIDIRLDVANTTGTSKLEIPAKWLSRSENNICNQKTYSTRNFGTFCTMSKKGQLLNKPHLLPIKFHRAVHYMLLVVFAVFFFCTLKNEHK